MANTTPNVYINAEGKIEVRPRFYPATELAEFGFRYDKKNKLWTAPLALSTIKLLERGWAYDSTYYELSQELHDRLNHEWGHIVSQESIDSATAGIPEYLRKVLYPYQLESVQYLITHPTKSALLALSPGLGKTLVSVAAALALQARRVLIVAPVSLLYTWVSEIKKWAPDQSVSVIHRQMNEMPSGWVVTNFETLVKFQGQFSKSPKWDVIIVDESILIKNRKSNRAKAVTEVRKNTNHIWLLSGSPVSRYADDLYSQLSILRPNVYTSFWRFANTYCYVETSQWGTIVHGTRPGINYGQEFKDSIFVRNQRDVLPNLPTMIHQTYTVQLTPIQLKHYKELHKQFITALNDDVEMKATTKVAQMIRLQQVTSDLANLGDEWPQASAKQEAILDILEVNAAPLPLLIWVHWTKGAVNLAKGIHAKFPHLKVAAVLGDTKNRTKIIEDYKEGKYDILILSLSVGKFGFTLTDTKSIIYYDKTFDADAYIQSLARVRRIGLTHVPLVIHLFAPKTTDELVQENLSSKAVTIARISNSDLKQLLEGLKGS